VKNIKVSFIFLKENTDLTENKRESSALTLQSAKTFNTNNLIKDIASNVNGGVINRVGAQLPAKQTSLNLNLNSPRNVTQSPTSTYRSFPGNKLSTKTFSTYKNLITNLNKRTKPTPTANTSFVQAWSSSSVTNIPESLLGNTQINYGPTISTANSNGSLSNYIINSVTNNSNSNKVTFSNGLTSSNSNGNTYRGSGGSLFLKSATQSVKNSNVNANGPQTENSQSPTHNNIHLTLPNHINNLTVQSKTNINSSNNNENASFTQLIDPLKDSNSKNFNEDLKKSNEDLV